MIKNTLIEADNKHNSSKALFPGGTKIQNKKEQDLTTFEKMVLFVSCQTEPPGICHRE